MANPLQPGLSLTSAMTLQGSLLSLLGLSSFPQAFVFDSDLSRLAYEIPVHEALVPLSCLTLPQEPGLQL